MTHRTTRHLDPELLERTLRRAERTEAIRVADLDARRQAMARRDRVDVEERACRGCGGCAVARDFCWQCRRCQFCGRSTCACFDYDDEQWAVCVAEDRRARALAAIEPFVAQQPLDAAGLRTVRAYAAAVVLVSPAIEGIELDDNDEGEHSFGSLRQLGLPLTYRYLPDEAWPMTVPEAFQGLLVAQTAGDDRALGQAAWQLADACEVALAAFATEDEPSWNEDW